MLDHLGVGAVDVVVFDDVAHFVHPAVDDLLVIDGGTGRQVFEDVSWNGLLPLQGHEVPEQPSLRLCNGCPSVSLEIGVDECFVFDAVLFERIHGIALFKSSISECVTLTS